MLKITIILCLIVSISCKTIKVSTDKELLSALSDLSAGDTIELADGKYHNNFIAKTNGTADKPITLTGSRKAVLSGEGYGYGFCLQANHWILKGFTVRDGTKGILLDNANHNLLEDLEVYNTKGEAIHFRAHSCDNILRKSYIHTTGRTSPGFGEGVYIGSAVGHWVDNKPDKSDRNQVLDNRIGPNVTAESIDIKEGTCCGVIKNNVFDGTGMSGEHYADSWIDMKGEDYTVEDNEGNHSILDGIQIHQQIKAEVWGCANRIIHDKCAGLPSKGKCVHDLSKLCAKHNIIEE